jgi:predicted RNase H-like nuclease (RuvC/YqgF family)
MGLHHNCTHNCGGTDCDAPMTDEEFAEAVEATNSPAAKEIETLKVRIAELENEAADKRREWDANLVKKNIKLYERAFKAEAEANTILQHCKTLEEQLATREVRIAELAKDAERYRKLRKMHWSTSPMCVVFVSKGVLIGADCPSGERLDAELDAIKEDGK